MKLPGFQFRNGAFASVHGGDIALLFSKLYLLIQKLLDTRIGLKIFVNILQCLLPADA